MTKMFVHVFVDVSLVRFNSW